MKDWTAWRFSPDTMPDGMHYPLPADNGMKLPKGNNCLEKKYQRFRCHVETSAHARCLSLRGRGVTLIFKCRAHEMLLKFLHHESGCATTVRNGVTKFHFSLKRLINLLADIMCSVECESTLFPVSRNTGEMSLKLCWNTIVNVGFCRI